MLANQSNLSRPGWPLCDGLRCQPSVGVLAGRVAPDLGLGCHLVCTIAAHGTCVKGARDVGQSQREGHRLIRPLFYAPPYPTPTAHAPAATRIRESVGPLS